MKSQTNQTLFKKLESLPQRTKRAIGALDVLKKIEPNPRCELFYKSPFQLLVSVVLSAQTTDKSVNLCMEPVYAAGLTPADVIKLGEDGFRTIIKRIGLAPTKARNVLALSKMIMQDHGGEVPNNREALEALPGVGRKTANVVLAEIFSAKTLAVDTHVYRVSQRLGLQMEKTADKAELELMRVVPPGYLPQAHHWFILHGRYTCKAAKPECERCPVTGFCRAFEEGKLPVKKNKNAFKQSPKDPQD